MTQAAAGDNGDVGEEWARLLVAVVIGIIGALVWTFADRKRPRGQWVGNALQLLLRYSIALGLISYGIAKIYPQQFPPIGPFELEQRVGDLTPMALLWEFMKYSRPYALFGGLMELLAVGLLCFRRTATLGALVCLVVMTNVALMNWAYGVPVKLYATMLVVSAMVLVLYDLPRLIAVFVTNRPTSPSPMSSPLQDRIPAPFRWTLKIAVVGSVVVSFGDRDGAIGGAGDGGVPAGGDVADNRVRMERRVARLDEQSLALAACHCAGRHHAGSPAIRRAVCLPHHAWRGGRHPHARLRRQPQGDPALGAERRSTHAGGYDGQRQRVAVGEAHESGRVSAAGNEVSFDIRPLARAVAHSPIVGSWDLPAASRARCRASAASKVCQRFQTQKATPRPYSVPPAPVR